MAAFVAGVALGALAVITAAPYAGSLGALAPLPRVAVPPPDADLLRPPPAAAAAAGPIGPGRRLQTVVPAVWTPVPILALQPEPPEVAYLHPDTPPSSLEVHPAGGDLFVFNNRASTALFSEIGSREHHSQPCAVHECGFVLGLTPVKTGPVTSYQTLNPLAERLREAHNLPDTAVLEPFHHLSGRVWSEGLDLFRSLVQLGMCPGHLVLEFGCGALDLGVHMIRFLADNRYVGVEGYEDALRHGMLYELTINHLHGSGARFVQAHGYRPPHRGFFGEGFDWVILRIDNLRDQRRQEILNHAQHYLRPRGRVVVPGAQPMPPADMESQHGLKFIKTIVFQRSLFPGRTELNLYQRRSSDSSE